MIVEHIERHLGIGGGDIASILGLSKFKTAIDVWEVKTQKKSSAFAPTFRSDKAFALESLMLSEYSKLYDLQNTSQYIIPNVSIIDDEEPIFQGHTDGIVIDLKNDKRPLSEIVVDDTLQDKVKKVLECKLVRFAMRPTWGENGSTDIPTEYLLQCAWYASILHVDVDLPVIFGDDDAIHVFHYKRDLELEKAIREHARRFWYDFVVPDKMPQPQTVDDLSRYYPQSNKDVKPIGLDVYEVAKSLKQVNSELKALQQQKEAYEKRLKEEIAESSGISFGGIPVANWITYDTQKFDRASFKDEHPELFEEYTSIEKQRRFYLKMEHSE